MTKEVGIVENGRAMIFAQKEIPWYGECGPVTIGRAVDRKGLPDADISQTAHFLADFRYSFSFFGKIGGVFREKSSYKCRFAGKEGVLPPIFLEIGRKVGKKAFFSLSFLLYTGFCSIIMR